MERLWCLSRELEYVYFNRETIPRKIFCDNAHLVIIYKQPVPGYGLQLRLDFPDLQVSQVQSRQLKLILSHLAISVSRSITFLL